MDKSNILKAFNSHFVEFIDDIQSVFPNDPDVMLAKTALIAIRKINPKLIINNWYEYIANKYELQIENEDLSFFIDKDYKDDLVYLASSTSDIIISKINILREPIRNMGEENRAKSMKYIINLSKLSKLYNK
jgi:hypothetical protein